MIISKSHHLIKLLPKTVIYQISHKIMQKSKYMFSSQNYMQTYTSDQIKIHHGRVRID